MSENNTDGVPEYVISVFERSFDDFQVKSVSTDLSAVNEASVILDFNDDGILDYVMVVTSIKRPTSPQLLVYWGHRDEIVLVERNEKISYPTPNRIEVVSKTKAGGLYAIDSVFGDAVLITKLESSSALLFWNGLEFQSIWLGD